MARNGSKSRTLEHSRAKNAAARIPLPAAPSLTPADRGRSPRMRSRLVAGALAALVIAVFGQVRDFDFINYDDIGHVYGNEFVRTGLSWRNFLWSFSLTGPSQWHPLTWLSHQLDCQLFGLNAGGHHLMSAGLHLASTILLFLLLRRMTGTFWPSALVAAMFGVHPQNVESVAWIAERKDVLSALFWVLTMLAYVSYARHRPCLRRYLVVFTLLALGLMAKPMLMTLPCALLLCDLWPLRRIAHPLLVSETGERSRFVSRPLGWLIVEKAPLLALSLASVVLTILRQPVTHGLGSGHAEPTPQLLRLTNGLIIYATYLRRLVWPSDLTISYDLARPAQLAATIAPALVSGAFLLAITGLAVRQVRRRPWLTVGWFWYLGVLVPVVGMFPFGMQTIADRYAYLPTIGVLIAVVWGAREAIIALQRRQALWAQPVWLWGGSLCGLAVLAGLAHQQASYWRDSITLFTRALEVRGDDHLAHNNLGTALTDRGRHAEAEMHFRKAVAMNPRHAGAQYNLANVLEEQGKLAEAETHYARVLEFDSQHAEAHINLGNLLHRRGASDEAIRHFEEALKVGRDAALAHYNLGIALDDLGRPDDAVAHFREAARLTPDDPEVHNNLGKALARTGQLAAAADAYRAAIALRPGYSLAHSNLASVLVELGDIGGGIEHFRAALKGSFPEWAMTASNLACVLATVQDARYRNGAEAVRYAEAASARMKHLHPRTLDILASAYAEMGRFSDAVQTSRRALQIALANQEAAAAEAIQYRMQLFAQGRPFRQSFSPNGN